MDYTGLKEGWIQSAVVGAFISKPVAEKFILKELKGEPNSQIEEFDKKGFPIYSENQERLIIEEIDVKVKFEVSK